MDQVRAILKVIWQQRFWVLAVLSPLIAAICWMMASGNLQAAFTANKATIETQFSAMASIANSPIHGSEDVNQKEREQAALISAAVRDLWQRLYDSQREQVLFWPTELGEDFVQYIDKRNFNDPISSIWRRRYLDYIKTRFDGLVEIVDAKKIEGPAGMTGGLRGLEGGGGLEYGLGETEPGVEKDYLVDWLDQVELREQLDFGGVVPSAQKIWVTQEDLWVYETLLKVIKKTNDARGATRAAENAAIRVITSLEVGQEAAMAMRDKGAIIMPEGGAGAGGMQELTGGMESGGGPVADFYGPESSGFGPEGGATDDALLNNRYVDQEGNPIQDTSAGLGVEYRRLPVRMVLAMDQRWIPRVLVECANATLPIEVQRLRINPEQSGAGFQGIMSQGTGGGMGLEGGGGARSFMTPGAGGFSSGMVGQTPEGLSKDYITVEIQGLVYIYNKPDDAALAVPGLEEAAAPADEVAMQQ